MCSYLNTGERKNIPIEYFRRFSMLGDVSSVSIGAKNESTIALPVEPETHVYSVFVKVFGRFLKPFLIQNLHLIQLGNV